jgi:hypothetical protein
MNSIIQSFPTPPMTHHARVRSQQRSIPKAVRDALIDYGERRRAGKGAASVFFTKKSWKRMEAYMGSDICRAFEKYRNCYLIEADNGAVITIAFRS